MYMQKIFSVCYPLRAKEVKLYCGLNNWLDYGLVKAL